MRNILFVSFEIAPVTPGGMGAFIEQAIQQINQNDNYNIYILMLADRIIISDVKKYFINRYKNVKFFFLDLLLFDDDLYIADKYFYKNQYAINSFKVYLGIKQIVQSEKIDVIEFFDYVGIAFYTIYNKYVNNEFQNINIAIRLHGSMKSIYKNQNEKIIDFSILRMLKMEYASLRFADIMFTPSISLLADYYKTFNNCNIDRKIFVSPPKIVNNIERVWNESNCSKKIFFFGRLQRIKGPEVLIKACVKLMKNNQLNDYEIILAGQDVNYKKKLKRSIPKEYLRKFKFVGLINHSRMLQYVRESQIAVVPSRWESYCIALFELKATGIPIIINDIPGFKDYFEDEVNCLIYKKNSYKSLSGKILLLTQNKELRNKLSNNYSYFLNDLVSLSEAYNQLNSVLDETIDIRMKNKILLLKHVDRILRKKHFTILETVTILTNFFLIGMKKVKDILLS